MSARRPRALSWLATASASLAAALASTASCDPVVGQPLSSAPVNDCSAHPCARYEAASRVRATCGEESRCEITGRPEYPYWIVVHVPETSIFAAGMTFVLSSDELNKPDPGTRSPCMPPKCLALPTLRQLRGTYSVSQEASRYLGYALEEDAYKVRSDTGERYLEIPVRVTLDAVGPDAEGTYPALPLFPMFVSSAVFQQRTAATTIQYARVVPPGRYRRVLVPEPPFDSYFPPAYSPGELITADEFTDDFRLGTRHPIDDVACDESGCVGGDSRVALVKRAEGLEGWRVWLAARRSSRRISTVRALSGTEATVRLETSGEGDALGDHVEAIVAPPDGWTAVPRLVTPLFGGQGLKNLAYPSVPPPVSVTGVVAEPGSAAGTVLGFSADLAFESQGLATLGEPTTLLRYTTSLSTDERGRFATVLPPGTYRVTTTPAEGTGFARTAQEVVVGRGPTAFTLRPLLRTRVQGKALLTDGRPAAEAAVLALPEEPPAEASWPKPRPGRARTDEDGRFALELDPGAYVVSVIPKAGTGFPRVFVRVEVGGAVNDLPAIRVPPPTRLSFTLRDPSSTGNPIVRALVRIFASFPGVEEPVEIGNAMTSPDGLVDILLAPDPH